MRGGEELTILRRIGRWTREFVDAQTDAELGVQAVLWGACAVVLAALAARDISERG